MKRLASIAECIGFLIILIGGSAMDSNNLTLPIVTVLVGVALLWTGASMEEHL